MPWCWCKHRRNLRKRGELKKGWSVSQDRETERVKTVKEWQQTKSTEKRWKLRHTEESMFITSSSPWVQLCHQYKNLRVLTDNKKGSVFTTLRSFRKEENRLVFWYIPFCSLMGVVSYPSRGSENRGCYWLDGLGSYFKAHRHSAR